MSSNVRNANSSSTATLDNNTKVRDLDFLALGSTEEPECMIARLQEPIAKNIFDGSGWAMLGAQDVADGDICDCDLEFLVLQTRPPGTVSRRSHQLICCAIVA